MQSHGSRALERPHPPPRAARLNQRQPCELQVAQRGKTCRARGAGRPSPGAQPAPSQAQPLERAAALGAQFQIRGQALPRSHRSQRLPSGKLLCQR
ncbi:hypothetical protein NDU88_005561 [Pleurodeles waltl]|uniref:Uncharacterized protein n=1 Tax=Pleurodeles waltl TaxID=8319 RepID=A0AAV7W9W5_PLEWA|nr:hypothetical protein NDU88_005561 [Pleurodeles waltl]